jgi:hypothetical protein
MAPKMLFLIIKIDFMKEISLSTILIKKYEGLAATVNYGLNKLIQIISVFLMQMTICLMTI